MFATLLDRVGVAGAASPRTRMHAQRGHAEYLATQRGAHYLLTVKGNQPGLRAQLAKLPWRQVPVAHSARERGHARAERRTVKVIAVAAGLAFPHAAQALRGVRRRRPLNSKKRSAETIYAITSLTAIQAWPAELAAIIRGHWLIEDRLHRASETLRRFTTLRPRCGSGLRACWAWRQRLSC